MCYNRFVSTRLTRLALLAVLFLAALGIPARARSGAGLTLFPPDLSQFPQILTYLDVRDAQGMFVSGLQGEHITLIEDGLEFAGATLTEQRPGAGVVVAVNPGQSFNIRDGEGFTRFQRAGAAMLAWADEQAANPGDLLSLLAPDGVLIRQSPDAEAWRTAWEGFTYTDPPATPGLETLGAALDLAGDTLPDARMGSAVLLITPVVTNAAAESIPSLAERALAQGIRVHVFLIDSALLFESPSVAALRQLAADTGGSFQQFSGSDSLPIFYPLFESSRRIYEIAYRSQLSTAGSHSLAVRVVAPQMNAISETRFFDLTLQPSAVAFVSPPRQVVRFIPEGERIAVENLQPTSQDFEILIEFPDQIDRGIVRATLFINGEQVAENTAPPFEFFTVDISAFESSEQLLLVAEVEDELGLTGRSIETPVDLTVRRPDTGLAAMLNRSAGVVSAAVAVAAGALLLLVLVLGGKLGPRSMGESTRPRPATNDPVTQPVRVVEEQPSRPRQGAIQRLAARLTAPRLRWPQRKTADTPFAYLVRIDDSGEPIGDGVFSIVHREIAFGADPAQAAVPLEDPAVEPLHARLWRDDLGQFHLADHGSTAGTWLNYAPVSRDGSRVEHGDLLHIGRVGFRFSFSTPPRVRKATVTKLANGRKESAE